jgi:16S rRNA (guanine527-N7)-methyltransferase
MADIGSGAGYPGIPLALTSGRFVTLIESRGRKASFLQEVVDVLGVDGDVAAVRAEELAAGRQGRYAVVTARAVAPLAALVELASPLLVEGGRLVAMKGSPEESELTHGNTAALLVGMKRLSVERVRLPGSDVHRTIVTYVRSGRPSVKLPRSPGAAQRRTFG